MSYKTILPNEISTAELQHYLQSSICPRPIAFASTISASGNINLSPYSFFNVFGINPPILIFSASRRVRDNTIKHTLENIYETKEVVINIVNYDMVEQTSLASCDYDKGVNEFIKSGLTPIPSLKIKPPRVKESPVSYECQVIQIIETGKSGGAGNLIICEVIAAHFKNDILNENGTINTKKIDTVARMGDNWYCRAHGESLFEVPKPNSKKGIGIDQIPDYIRNSSILTGNDLGRLGNIEKTPSLEEANEFKKNNLEFQKIKTDFEAHSDILLKHIHLLAKTYLNNHKIEEAWKILL